MEIGISVCQTGLNNERKNFQMTAKPIGPICNLRCKYCYCLEKKNMYPQRVKKTADYHMSDRVLEQYIKSYIESQPSDKTSIMVYWQGGEPTMLGIEFFNKVLTLQKKYADGRPIENTVQTNGMLIDQKWAAFFKKHDFLICISIDGPQFLHDAYRYDQAEKGSWKRVMRSIELLKKFGVRFTTLTAVNNLNSKYPLCVYNFLKSIGSTCMQFIPVQERMATDKSEPLRLVANDYTRDTYITKESVKPRLWGSFLNKIFDKWIKEDVGNVFIKQFDCALEAWCGHNPSACDHSKYCGDSLVVEHNGDVYHCDQYVYPQFKLGNIMKDKLADLANGPEQQKFGALKQSTLSKRCLACKYLAACNGECPKHRFMENSYGEKEAYLCEGYYAFYDHIDPYMVAMRTLLKQGHDACDIMNVLKLEGNFS